MKTQVNINDTKINYQHWWVELVKVIGRSRSYQGPATGLREPQQSATASDPSGNYLWCCELEQLAKEHGLKVGWTLSPKLMNFKATLYFSDPKNFELTKNKDIQDFHKDETISQYITLREFSYGGRKKHIGYLYRNTEVESMWRRHDPATKGITTNRYEDLHTAVREQCNPAELYEYSNKYDYDFLTDRRWGTIAWVNIVLDALMEAKSVSGRETILNVVEKMGLNLIFSFDENIILYHMVLRKEAYRSPPFVFFFEDSRIPPITHIIKDGKIQKLKSADELDYELIDKLKAHVKEKDVAYVREITSAQSKSSLTMGKEKPSGDEEPS